MGKYDMGQQPSCGCEQTMTLTLEDNTTVKCTVIKLFDIAENTYIALLPKDDEYVLLYRYTEIDEEPKFRLDNIETDEEFKLAEDTFFELIDEDGYGYEDEDEEEYEYEQED